MTERIIAAALRLATGEVFSAPPPARHSSVILLAQADGMDPQRMIGHVQGFMTSAGRFVDRQEAWVIAYAAWQLVPASMRGDVGTPGTLYSEDVW